MIVVDTSALIAIILDEPEAQTFTTILGGADVALVGAPNLLELHLVLSSKLADGGLRVTDRLLRFHSIRIVDWETRFVSIARSAFDRFGKGRHPARLNFGDCMAYALAKAFDAPLLFKGNDFAQTDIRSAI